MFQSINPATGENLATYDELTADQVEAKVAKAVEAFHAWRTTDLPERAALLEKIAEAFDANMDRLARMASQEMGKTYKSSVAELQKCAAGFRHYAQEGPAMLAVRAIDLGAQGKAEVHWLPQGPVLAVMPWNFPYWQVVRFAAPTILAGNVGLLKHASNVQGCAALIEEMIVSAGAPAGLFQNLAIKSSKVEALIDDPRIVAVTLTGSEGAGMAVAEAAGRNLKKVVLELGGSDPFIVMPSADLEKAAETAVKARIQNTGQSCVCAKRMIVHTEIYEAFMEKFEAGMRAVKAGDPFADDTDMGPLSSAEQLKTVQDQLAMAEQKGAKLLFGGETPEGKGAFMTAGVLVDVPTDDAFAHEEIFGPIAMVFKVADLDEAIERANDVPFGLGSSVWTTDKAEQDRFVRDIEAGMTAINQLLASAPAAPFGGVKRSGHGRELSVHGLHEFMNLKTVMLPAA